MLVCVPENEWEIGDFPPFSIALTPPSPALKQTQAAVTRPAASRPPSLCAAASRPPSLRYCALARRLLRALLPLGRHLYVLLLLLVS